MAWMRNEPDTTPSSPATPSPSPAASPRAPSSGSSGRTERAVIGSSISVQGDIKGEEDLTILGQVQGTVDVKNNSVTVGQSGHVKADLHADLIVVEGRVEGNLFGTDQIILRATANVQGNLTAPRVALEDGAQFKGAIDMEPVRKGQASSGAAGGPSGSSGSSASGGSGVAKGSADDKENASSDSGGSGKGTGPGAGSAGSTSSSGGGGKSGNGR